ncbi:methyltransferase type 11 [Thozetella sp. PMI_491]|nr:methyltransferase type 11 [Thozetella sp. PMI_491]
MSDPKSRFNAEAAAWDSNPYVHRASEEALQAILAAHPELVEAKNKGTTATEGIDVLEIGCGTGLLSLLLAPYVRSIVAVDAAGGMIDKLSEKLAALPEGAEGRNITPLHLLLEDPEDASLPPAHEAQAEGPRRKFDLVTSHLVLHHIPDLAAVLQTMHGCLKPGGRLALTDFEDFGPAARRFHPESKMEGVERHGVNAVWFAGLMRDAGFTDVEAQAAWTMNKAVERFPGEWNAGKPQGEGVVLETMDFPFLLCQGTKP